MIDVAEWHPLLTLRTQTSGPWKTPGPWARRDRWCPGRRKERKLFSRGKVAHFCRAARCRCFSNAQEGDAVIRDQQAADVAKYTQLHASGDIEAARALKKVIMQQWISSHRYTSILIEYHAKLACTLEASFTFSSVFRRTTQSRPCCVIAYTNLHPNTLHEPDSAPREQNVCCSYHTTTNLLIEVEGYEAGRSLWKVVWAIRLRAPFRHGGSRHLYAIQSPNKEAADQFLRDEPGFMRRPRLTLLVTLHWITIKPCRAGIRFIQLRSCTTQILREAG